MYSATTHRIKVTVRPQYIRQHSNPEAHDYVWAYFILIENQGEEAAQLLSRYWRITDSFGRIQEVRGPGVIGQQPRIRPGQAFEYNSGTQLQTPSGIMEGQYEMMTDEGVRFWIDVPAFSLDIPGAPMVAH